MDFGLGDDARRRLSMLRSLGAEVFRPLGLEADRAGEPIPPEHPFFQRIVDLGLVSPLAGESRRGEASERDAGAGAGDVEAGPASGRVKRSARMAVLFAEEASYWDRGVAVTLPGPGLGGPPVQKMGTAAQQERFLSPFREKVPRWGAFAMTEPGAGSDVAGIRTSAKRIDGGWVLNGAKTFISNAKRAEWVVVFATVDPALGRAGHRAFVVERGTPGFTITRVEKKMGLKAYESCSFTLEDCRVSGDHLLGGEAYYASREGFKGAMSAFNSSRALVAVMAIGIGRAAWDRARDFVRDHYDLGRPIPRYRRLLERLADVKRKLDAGRVLAWRGAWLLDHGRPNALEASMAKAHCPPAALEACRVAVEILGDAGVRQDELVEKLYRDVKAMDIVEGTQQIQRTIIARRLFGYPSERGTGAT